LTKLIEPEQPAPELSEPEQIVMKAVAGESE